ncbi:MAG TPA: flavin reductase family protein [Candidatus Limnocylindria bacterium]|jgi:flavin reductase (DIM6/NTAB) family NADH-FMN oxidoreductase RutF|nr:flavin reductase family protein [Candidatus Limnocylindria bacterium]
MASLKGPTTDKYAPAKLFLSRIAHPVAIIGAAHEGERSCATGTVMYVSHIPAMVAIAEHPGSRTTRLIRASREFSVSLLHDSQQELAVAAGRSADGPDKFAALKIPVIEQPGFATPGVEGSLAIFWCQVHDERPTGDHILFVGDVVGAVSNDRKIDALLRYRRRYMRMGHWTSEEAPEGYPT